MLSAVGSSVVKVPNKEDVLIAHAVYVEYARMKKVCSDNNYFATHEGKIRIATAATDIPNYTGLSDVST